MPGPKRGFTTPHTCTTVDSTARNQPSERDRKAREKGIRLSSYVR